MDLEIGAKVELTENRGISKRKRKSRDAGVIVGENRAKTCWYIKWDGIVEPDLLHKDFVCGLGQRGEAK